MSLDLCHGSDCFELLVNGIDKYEINESNLKKFLRLIICFSLFLN